MSPNTGLLYPPTPNSIRLRPAPLFHSRPDHKQLAAIGGRNSRNTLLAKPAWQRTFPGTLGAIRRWYPNDPSLGMEAAAQAELFRLAWEAGFKAGAGYKRS